MDITQNIERSLTGMTDKQFQMYQKSIWLHLKEVLEALPAGPAKDKLQELADSIKESFSRP